MIARLLALLAASLLSAHADVLDEQAALQRATDTVAMDLAGQRWSAAPGGGLTGGLSSFSKVLVDPAALRLLPEESVAANPAEAAMEIGVLQARIQHVAALEMLAALRAGNIERAREWRATIKLPKYANAVEGTLALERLGADPANRDAIAALLAREYLQWQTTRAREQADLLTRTLPIGRWNDDYLAGRMAEIRELGRFPEPLLSAARVETTEAVEVGEISAVLSSPDRVAAVARWREMLESRYPNLLGDADVESRERMLLKLLRLVPVEYQSGVRNGEIVIPIEFREALTFTIQIQRTLSELQPVWSKTKAAALENHGPELSRQLVDLEAAIQKKAPQSEIVDLCRQTAELLQGPFGLSLKRHGPGSDAVSEAALEIRALLQQSLDAALAGRWRQAEAFRFDAYVAFDLDIEMRTLPRDPALAMRAEKTFLGGTPGEPGIKAAIDARLPDASLREAYQRAVLAVDECASLARVGLSPGSASLSAALIVLREGLEAVVILAALLAGLRGPENAGARRQIGWGSMLALAASAAIFAVSRSLLSGLARYGEILEAIISILAMAILLMVTNWVFHKYYWAGWNSRLRQLSKAAQAPKSPFMESLAFLGVGFMTIFREGFETTLFMQSLILEAGMSPTLRGLAIGGALIAILGFAVFALGARLPYRKMLVVTGLLVVFVLFTFTGSTVRIFQTVGWLPIHPITAVQFPDWMGVWLGLYPSVEGLVLPFLALTYIAGAWLWVKISSLRAASEDSARRLMPTA